MRWRTLTEDLRARLKASSLPITPAAYDSAELRGLPGAVERYFRAVLKHGQPMIASATAQHTGQFSADGDRWSRFTSDQLVITRRPGFDWDARIRLFPGLPIFVHDGYVAGEGILRAAAFGLLTVAELRGSPEIAHGELMRFMAEAVWYPTALLPSQGVLWEAIDENSARASLTDGATRVSIDFRFNAEGLVQTVYAPARFRTVGREQVPTPWEGRFWAYEVSEGMRIPLEGEVAWLLEDGPMPYWRGRITSLVHEFVK